MLDYAALPLQALFDLFVKKYWKKIQIKLLTFSLLNNNWYFKTIRLCFVAIKTV